MLIRPSHPPSLGNSGVNFRKVADAAPDLGETFNMSFFVDEFFWVFFFFYVLVVFLYCKVIVSIKL